MVDREPLSRPAEAGHDFIGDQQDPVLVAELAQTLEESGRRDDETRVADDRLEQDRRDVLRALVPEHLLDVRERGLRGRAVWGAVRIGVEEADDTGDAGLVGPAAVIAPEGHRPLRLPVERAVLGHDLVAAGEHARDADRVLVRLGAACCEQRLRQIARGDLSEKTRELGALLLTEARRDVAEPLGLLLDRAHDLRMSVSEVDIHKA